VSPWLAHPVGLSLVVAGASTVLLLPIGLLVGWGLARRRFFGKPIVETLVSVPLVLPPVVTGYLLLLLFGRQGLLGGWLQTAFGLELATTTAAAVMAAMVMASPLMVGNARLAFELVDPKLEEAAMTLRCGWPARFMRVTLPLAWPGISAGLALSFARSLGEFGATIVFAGNIPGETQTIPLAVYASLQRPAGEQQALLWALWSVGISAAALLASERFARRQAREGRRAR